MDGELVAWDEAKVHILTHSLHYGSGVFEGIRAYSTSQGAAVFRLTDHIKRLFTSAKVYLIDIPYSVDDLVEAVKDTVRVNKLDACYIRPIVYLGYGEMGLNPLPCPVNVSIAVWPWGTYLGEKGIKEGVRCKISSWQRHDPNAVPVAAKGTGMYGNSSLAKVEALKAGYDEAILLSPQGYVSECTGENLFIVKHGRILTPPSAAGALEGITQDSVSHHRPRPGLRGGGVQPAAHRPLPGRGGLPHRHRGRGGSHPLGRRPGDRRARPHHQEHPGDLLRHRPGRGRPLQELAGARECLISWPRPCMAAPEHVPDPSGRQGPHRHAHPAREGVEGHPSRPIWSDASRGAVTWGARGPTRATPCCWPAASPTAWSWLRVSTRRTPPPAAWSWPWPGRRCSDGRR